MRRVPHLFAALLAIGLTAAACSDDAGRTIDLDDAGLTPATDDIQSDAGGENLAHLTFSTLNGEPDGFANHLDKPLVVNFFAAWCGPCRAEMPEFEEVFQDVRDDVNFLGISRDDTAGPSIDLIDETGVTYAIGWDDEASLFPDLGLFAMPSTLFVDTNGAVVDQWGGILSADGLRELIEESLL